MRTTYDFIDQNKRRTWLLVLLFPLTFAALAYATLWGFYSFAGAQTTSASDASYAYSASYAPAASSGVDVLTVVNQTALWVIPLCWAVALLWVFVSYYKGDELLLRSAHAHRIYKEDQPEIYRLVENLCIASGLPVPAVYIMDDPALNAFATGRDPQHASIALTKGIVQKLDRVELEGVIAHELAHVQNRDIRLMLITVAGISFFTLVGEALFYAALRTRRSGGKEAGKAQALLMVAGIVFLVYGYLIAPLIRLAVSRVREYQADASAALTTRNPAALASALRKISGGAEVEALQAHASMAAMCISNPLKDASVFAALSNLTATHPPIEERIKRLNEMARIVSA